MSGKQKRLSNVGKITLIGLSLLLTANLWFRIDNATAVSRLEKAARAKKAPLTLSDLSKLYPPIPEEQNAAIPLLELWRRNDADFWQAFERGITPLPRPKPEPPILKQAAEYDREFKPPLRGGAAFTKARTHVLSMETRREMVRQAVARGRARFNIRLEEGLDALLPHLMALVREAHEFHLEALVAIEEDRPADALRAIETIAGLGNLLREDVLLIGQLTRFRCLALAIADMGRLLGRQPVTAAQLNRIEAVLNSTDTTDAFSRIIQSEQASILSAFTNPDHFYLQNKGNEPRRLGRHAVRLMKILGLADADRRLILETFVRLEKYSVLTSLQDLGQIGKITVDANAEADSFPPKIISKNSLPDLELMARRCARMKALQSAALTAVAVERHRLQNKRLPALLEDLQPRFMAEIPTDLFSGKPLQFEILDDGHLIYSVGPDGKDNGGVPSLGLDPSRSPDVVFGVGR